jgi:hypothetical protein
VPITIGNTTITGIAAGGLPENSITGSDLGGTGAVINVSRFESNTRISTSSSADLTYYSFNVTKLRTNSILIVQGASSSGGVSSTGIYFFVSFGASKVFRGIGHAFRYHGSESSANSIPGGIHFTVPSPTGIAAGTVVVGLGQQSANGSSNRPVNIINPSTTDDDRNNCGTTLIVYEVTI